MSGSAGPDAALGDFTISVDPGSLTLPIAGSGTATVTVARTGDVGDIMLGTTGLGANLTASFSPNPIPVGATTSQATITVAGGSAPAMSTVTITGSAGASSHTAMMSVTSTTITVTGTVRGNVAGVKVGIIGKQSVTSGAGGVFAFADVTPPYDLYTFGSSGSNTSPVPTVFLFRHLTRPDPTVTAPTTFTLTKFILCGIIGGSCPNAPISGTRSGSSTNTDPVAFAWTGPGASFNSAALATNGTYTGTMSWSSGTTTVGALHALQFTRRASGAPNTFIGYAKTGPADITVTSGTALAINLVASPVASTATLTGTLAGPAGYPGPSISLFQQFGPTQAPLWTTTTTTTVDATFPLLAGEGTSLFASTSLADGSGSSLFVQPLTATVAVNVVMPAAAVLGMPADAATGITSTSHFTWTSAPQTINELDVGASAVASYKIFTTDSDVTIPVVPELALPANTGFSWSLVGYGPHTDVNEAAAATALEAVSSSDYQGLPHAQTQTAARSFTTAP